MDIAIALRCDPDAGSYPPNPGNSTPSSAAVELEAWRDDGQVAFEVRDDGQGIDAAVLPDVFERFRHGSGNGSGLGLALVREIVERHRGTVALADPAP